MQPDYASFLLNTVYLPSVKNEFGITKGVIQAIPTDKGDYRPDDISKSAIDLAWHIVGAEVRFLDAVSAGAFNLSPSPRPEHIRTSADVLTWYADNVGPAIDKLATSSPDQLLKIVDFRGMFQMPAVMYLGFMMHHTVHHRGQLSMYLRPMGAKVPIIYGESYDTKPGQK